MNTITTHPDRDSWLAARRLGIGASDAAAVLGESTWQSPYSLWAEKTGQLDSDDNELAEFIEWGNRLQEPIVDAYRERSGRIVNHELPFTIRQHPHLPWMLASLDATQDEGGDPSNIVPVEVKTAGEYKRGDWDEGPPLAYQIQLQHQMAVTGAPCGTIVVLIGGQRMRWFDCDRNDRFIEAMIEQEEEFWRRVEQRIPPPADGHAATRHALARLFPQDNGEAVWLPGEIDAVIDEWEAAKERVKEWTAIVDAAKTRIAAEMGAAALGTTTSGWSVTYKTQDRDGYYVNPTSFRVLRSVKPKALARRK